MPPVNAFNGLFRCPDGEITRIKLLPGNGGLGDDVKLAADRWRELRFDWSDARSSVCELTIDGEPTSRTLPLVRPSVHGISYVHFQALSDEEDQQGFLIESVEGGR
jgi:hypothetical protein